MVVFVPVEVESGESRVAVTPEGVAKLVKLGLRVVVESRLAGPCRFADAVYREQGAELALGRPEMLAEADMVLRVRRPPLEEVALLKPGAVHVSFLDPFNNPELVEALAEHRVTAISMEMIPRTAFAQKMDALSSQANLAGYVAVVTAAARLNKVFPMMMTAAGTLAPARVFVIGVGVAGLQAIATAKRLGARVEAFDTRPSVAEQVQSLGARFVHIDIGETGETAQGYAKTLTPEQLERQREGMARACAQSDVVITAAQVFGKRAPVLITREMIGRMRPGSVIVDCAVESGGNVEGMTPNEEVEIDGVRVVGLANLPGRVCVDASLMYSSNIVNLVELMWDVSGRAWRLDHELVRACTVTRGGEVVNEAVREGMATAGVSR